LKRTALLLVVNFLVGAAGLVWALARFGRPAFALLARAPSPPLFAGFVAAMAAGLLLDALRWRILLGALCTPPSLVLLAGLRAAGQSVSSLLPSAKLGGEPLRMMLATRAGVPAADAIATVAVDRTLEVGSSTAAACVFALVLLAAGLPGIGGALVTVGLAAAGLVVGVVLTARRLRRGGGLVSALVRLVRLDRLGVVGDRLDVVTAAERAAARLLDEPRRLALAFGCGALGTVAVLVEYAFLLAAFDLPRRPLDVVGAVFASGAAHALPVPASVGALEGATIWLFGLLGHPAAVGLAVGLAARLRELLWVAPGLLFLALRPVLTRPVQPTSTTAH
jgi:uncharacterized membrane protein YbhN (UPF0104 family)